MATLRGTTLDDTLEAFDDGDVLYGLGNNDDVIGYGAGVRLYGGDGGDFVSIGTWDNPAGLVSSAYGDGGNDDVVGSSYNDRLYGGDGDDYLIMSEGTDTLNGGAGQDVLVLYNLTNAIGPDDAVRFNLDATGAGRFSRDTGFGIWTAVYSGIEGVVGTGGSDSLTGNDLANRIYGSVGDDTLRGRGGEDLLRGEEGRDVLTGGTGGDLFVMDGAVERWQFRNTADRITDFDVTEDKIVFFARNFSGLEADISDDDGFIQAMTQVFAIDDGQFVVQDDRYATTLSARLIYDQDDGLLYYDANGALTGFAPVLVANIGAGLALTSDNFALI